MSPTQVQELQIGNLNLKVGNTIRVINSFQANCAPPKNTMLTPDMNDLFIKKMYADGWISLNRKDHPWKCNKPVCYLEFGNIEVITEEYSNNSFIDVMNQVKIEKAVLEVDESEDSVDDGDIMARVQLLINSDSDSDDEIVEEAKNLCSLLMKDNLNICLPVDATEINLMLH
jgi:hypothetical protein